ncbi:hypothetical protein GCM10009860_12950 [Microbacterium mitrae]|uniref:Alpha/beta fold hydrolase n=1 Tax=Microbacterium mitrae TaxID=664640 RepID=A0A5C8HU77_9MICO|nr:alpha/beta fold hydrolase [Microbacterium mitrae]TXK06591.1 alpha/beta fold hydrolase [Microbacterium mitrae]
MPEKIALREALIAQALAKLPWQVRVAIAAVAIVAGVLIIGRPTLSLDVLAMVIGVGAITEGVLALWHTPASVRWRLITATAWITVGIIVLQAQWLTVLALTVLVGIGLVAVGAYRIYRAVRSDEALDEKIASITIAVATILFGVVAFFWRDISLVVLSVVFGAWLVITGIDAGWRALPRNRREKERKRRTGWRRFGRSIVALVTVSAAVLAVGITVVQTGPVTVTDTFYAAPRNVPDEPGRLIQYEPITEGIPGGAVGFRFLYTTQASDGTIDVASAIAISPDDDETHPSVTWAHSTTGITRPCAPSLQPDPFRSGGMFAARHIIKNGWALIAPDYVGLGTAGEHPYLIGEDSGRAVLDATRAAYSIIELRISRTTVLWGHSQGGHAALWASSIAAEYAPQLDVRGVAAISPVSDLTSLVSTMDSVTGGMVFASFVLHAYEQHYDDIQMADYLRPGTISAARDIPSRCLDGPGSWRSALVVATRLADPSLFRIDPRTGPLGERLRENIPQPSQEIPLLIVAGSADPLIKPSVQSGYVASLCATKTPLAYRTIPDADHISMLYGNSEFLPSLLSWTGNRFLQLPAKTTC